MEPWEIQKIVIDWWTGTFIMRLSVSDVSFVETRPYMMWDCRIYLTFSKCEVHLQRSCSAERVERFGGSGDVVGWDLVLGAANAEIILVISVHWLRAVGRRCFDVSSPTSCPPVAQCKMHSLFFCSKQIGSTCARSNPKVPTFKLTSKLNVFLLE